MKKFFRAISLIMLAAIGCTTACGISSCSVSHAQETKFEDEINFDNLSLYADTNADRVAGFEDGIKGIVIQFHSISDTSTEGDRSMRLRCNRAGVLYVFPYGGPWNWMNKSTVRLADRVIDVLIEHFELSKDIPVVSMGGSMGGEGALVYPVYSKHNIVAVAADSPVCDIRAECEFQPMFTRTIVHAVGDYYGPYDDAVNSISAVKLVDKMPKVPYFIVHGGADDSVPADINSDVLVPLMREAGFDVTYERPETMTHVNMPPSVSDKWFEFIFSKFE